MPARSAAVIGSSGPIEKPRNPTISSRAAFRRMRAAASAEGVGSGLGLELGLGADGEGVELGGEGLAGEEEMLGTAADPHATRPIATEPAPKARRNERRVIGRGVAMAAHDSGARYRSLLDVSQLDASPES